MMAGSISRRDFVIVGAGLAAGLAANAALAPFALADSGGSGSGSGDGSGGSIWGGQWLENSLIWWDRGGFADNNNYDESSIKYREDSVQHFWSMMKSEVKNKSGLSPRTTESATWGYISTYIQNVLRTAYKNAEAREKALGAKDPKGRIVAVGWVWGDFGDGWQLATSLLDSSRQTYSGIIYRKATASELPNAYGWGDKVADSSSLDNGSIWRDAIYNMGKRDNPGGNYSIIALAVTDTMLVPPTGFVQAHKTLGL